MSSKCPKETRNDSYKNTVSCNFKTFLKLGFESCSDHEKSCFEHSFARNEDSDDEVTMELPPLNERPFAKNLELFLFIIISRNALYIQPTSIIC